MGYYRAGFEVVGVDIEPQKRYPFEFHQGDAIEFILKYGKDFNVIAGSPPCQLYSVTASLSSSDHPDLIAPTREAMIKVNKPYVIENVPGAPLVNPIMLCGTMFGLRVIRHRLFECQPALWFPPASCCHWGKRAPIMWRDLKKSGYISGVSILDKFDFMTVAGNSFRVDDAKIAMGIDWMIGKELSQAIPPAYTEWLGKELRKLLKI